MYKGTSGLCDYIFLYINVFMEYCANVIWGFFYCFVNEDSFLKYFSKINIINDNQSAMYVL